MELETRPQGGSHGSWGWARVALVVLATILLIAANILFWARTTLLDSGEFTGKVSSVLRQDEATQRLGDVLAQQVMSSGRLQADISAALPANAGFLPHLLERELQEVLARTLTRVLRLDVTQETLERAIRQLHNLVVSTLEGRRQGLDVEDEDLVIHLGPAISTLLQRLNLEGPSVLQDRDVGRVVLVRDAESLSRASRLVRAVDEGAPLLLGAALLLFGASIALAPRKARGVTVAGYGIAIAGLVSLIAWRLTAWGSSAVLDEAPVTRLMIESLAGNLRLQALLLMAIGAAVVVLADPRIRGWITGHATSAWTSIEAFGAGRAALIGAAGLTILLMIS